jgi:predicted transcriptional regulator
MELSSIGNSIKEKRKELGYTQVKLAEFSATSINSVKKIEAGFLDEVGIKKVVAVLDVLALEFCLRPQGRPFTLDELNGKS